MKKLMLGLGVAAIAITVSAPSFAREVKQVVGYVETTKIYNDRDAEFHMGEGAADEIDECAAIGAPIGIEQFLFFEQVAREIQRRPGRAVGGGIVIFEELGIQRPIGCGVGNLMVPDPSPQ